MRRFFQKWLLPILIALILAALALGIASVTRRLEERAKEELSTLADAAFRRVEERRRAAEPIIETAKENLVSKTVAVVRFLAHDDELLDADALVAFCEQLDVDRIDVADSQGVLIASSDAARAGLALAAQEAFAWTGGALDDPTQRLSQTDETTPSLVYACVPRTDIEGFVLAARDDPSVRAALAVAGEDALVENLALNGDLVFRTDKEGADGFFYESGSLCLLSTREGLSLIAARPTSNVFAERNAMLVALGVTLLCGIIVGVAAYLVALGDGAQGEREPVSDDAIALPPAAEKPHKKREPSACEDAEAAPDARRRRTARPDDPDAAAEKKKSGAPHKQAEARHTDRPDAGRRREPKRADSADDESAFDRIMD